MQLQLTISGFASRNLVCSDSASRKEIDRR